MKKQNHRPTSTTRLISGGAGFLNKILPRKFTNIFFISFFLNLSIHAQHWDSLRGGINRTPTCLYEDTVTSKLYVGGNFKKADHKWINGIGSWNSSQWDSLGHGIDFFDTIANHFPANTLAITRYGNYLYAGGSYRMAGNIMTNGLARWDGTNWDSVPGAKMTYPNSCVSDIKTYNSDLYICGSFDSVGNVPASGIAKWDGATWQAIGSNYQFTAQASTLSKIVFYHADLYVGGMFYDSLGNSCRLAKWDGSNWQFLTTSLEGGIADFADFAVYNNELYVSGLFYTSTGNAGTGIMRWNDTTWRDVGGGLQLVSYAYPRISEMCVHNGKLYCVGLFDYVGGVNANNVASWDGTQWCGYGTTFDNTVGSIAFLNDTMYLGGAFWHEDSDSIHYIIKWVGGSYVDTCGVINTGLNEQNNNSTLILLYPNPASENIIFEINESSLEGEIIIYDQLGRKVRRQKINGEKQIEISVADLANGMYFYQVVEKDNIRSGGKFIVQH